MVTYEQWNKAIIKHIFEACDPGETVFLNTTSETLREIAEQEGFDVDAVESLKEAVRKKVVVKKNGYPNKVCLAVIDPKCFVNKTPENEPPQVAFLALTVLAASRMESSEGASHTNYYVQLNKLLFDKSIIGKPKGIKYEDWEDFWLHFRGWVKSEYDVELYLTQGHPKYVWYPISQCLISKHDEHILHGIFKEMNLKPGAYLDESQLLDIICSCQSFQNLSVKIKRPIQDQNTAEIRLILVQIQLLLENWDGEVQERTLSGIANKRKFYTIDVQLKFNPFRSEDIEDIRYWFRCGRSTQIDLKPNALNVKSLQSDDGKWFEPLAVDADISSLQMLQNGFEIKSEETKSLTYRLKPSDIWVFRNESEPDDGWFIQGNLLLHELHRIVFRKEQNLPIISILKHACDPFTSPKSICVGGEETDWQYVEVRPTVLVSNPIFGYRITTSDNISFIGGLPLDRRSNTYFDFCLPTIVIPNLVTDSDKMFYINGQATEVPIDRKIELPNKLGSTEYRLSYLDRHTKLNIISPVRSTEHEKQTLALAIDPDSKILPVFKDCKVTEISAESSVWLAGAKFFGAGIIVPPPNGDNDSVLIPPAEIISSVVKLAIELKQGKTSLPEWFYPTIKYLDENVTLRAHVKKKLKGYRETALSYSDLCRKGRNSSCA